ncbi:MAG: class I SAM-dependent methyltransferase [Dongiaceae bacterium]
MSVARRAAWRRLRLGLPALLGLGGGGYFIPYRYAGRLPPAGTRPPYAALEARFAASAGIFAGQLDRLASYRAELARIGREAPPAPRWAQDWFPRLDAAIAYLMVRERRPRLVLEVGSGHSTRFIARAIADGGLATRHVALDPAPRADLAGLPVELRRGAVPAIGEAEFAALAAGDALVIDSSHVLMPGSDVDFLLNRVLPGLPPGVLVHVHDVFLPDDYPAEWAWRGYNEQLAVAALLTGGGWRACFASHYVATRMADRLAASLAAELPLVAGARESSLWMERTA